MLIGIIPLNELLRNTLCSSVNKPNNATFILLHEDVIIEYGCVILLLLLLPLIHCADDGKEGNGWSLSSLIGSTPTLEFIIVVDLDNSCKRSCNDDNDKSYK